MKDHKIAIRYAAALLKLAHEEGAIDKVREGLDNFIETINKNGGFFLWLADDEIPHSRRDLVLREIASPLALHSLVLKFLEVLIHRNRIGHIVQIAHSFNEQADEFQGVMRGKIMVAQREHGENVRAKLENLFSAKFNKNVVLTVNEDMSLVGGLLVHMRDYIWDASVKRMLSEIKEKICQ